MFFYEFGTLDGIIFLGILVFFFIHVKRKEREEKYKAEHPIWDTPEWHEKWRKKVEEQVESYKKEIDLEGHASPISMEQMKYILKQMEKSIYKIKCEKGTGSGFLCLIPFPTKLNLLPTLITNNHVLSEKDIDINQKI